MTNFPKLSSEGERVLTMAASASEELQHGWLGVEHIVLGLHEAGELADGPGFEVEPFIAALRERIVESAPANEEDILVPSPRCREVLQIAARIASRSGRTLVGPADLFEAVLTEGRSVPARLMRNKGVDIPTLLSVTQVEEQKPRPTPTPLIDRFGRDLTALARDDQLSPVIGREEEINRIAEVLLRKNKNNPVLVGEAGVGKTAVVEGLAHHLVSAGCPVPLQGRRVIELSLGSLVAGTKFRGEFEERLIGIVKEAADHPDLVLFVDEIHTVVGAGSTGGDDSLDAANILKPALARGELRCVGATTMAEYRRTIDRDPALERRFEKIHIEEPSREDALEILSQLRPALEDHHEIEIEPEALHAAVDLTLRHVPERRLPDKALDAIDQSCARRRLERWRTAADGETTEALSIGAEDVAATVSQWTGIPLQRVSGEAARELLGIEEELLARVVGQEDAVRKVSRTVLTARAGLSDPDRPLGVFFFAGPTGVGKTHMAKCLAEVLFGSQDRLVRIDMSEYGEAHSVANLIGSPPGYVGHEQEGRLIAALRTHPHSIVLFDEVEKAHPRIFDLFLQIFDDGRLTGTHGKVADFTQAVVILTSNIPLSEEAAPALGFGGGAGEDPPVADVRKDLSGVLRPELVNRLDEIINFSTLGGDSLRRIVDAYVSDVESRLADRGLELHLDEAVYEMLLERADCTAYGARELRRLVDKLIRQPLAVEVLRHGEEAAAFRLMREGEEITFAALKDDELTA